MIQKLHRLRPSRTALLAAAVAIVVLAVVFISNLGDKQLRFLKADNVTSITLTDQVAGQTIELSERDDIQFLIDTLKEVTTYANVRSKDASGGQLIFSIHYEDGRARDVILADPARTSEKAGEVSGKFGNASLQVNKRWYKTKAKTVELLYNAYQETR